MEYNIIIILLIHFFADFIFQTRKMGRNKSISNYWLTMHVFTYTIVTTFGWFLFLDYMEMGAQVLVAVFLITFCTHYLTDFITSKANGYSYLKMNEKNRKTDFWEFAFWGVIGFDQFIHALTLILTYKFLYLY